VSVEDNAVAVEDNMMRVEDSVAVVDDCATELATAFEDVSLEETTEGVILAGEVVTFTVVLGGGRGVVVGGWGVVLGGWGVVLGGGL
jgi:hypothetical protein